MNTPTNWLQGFLALGFGLVVSVAFVFFARRMFKATASDGSADDLQARYATLIGQLKEHAQAKHQMPAERWAAEEQRLSAEAAALLRQRDSAAHAEEKARARAEKKAKQELSAPPANPVVKIAGWVAIAAVFLGVVAMVLLKEAKDRQDDPPPQQTNAAARPAAAEDVARNKALLEAAQNNPDDIDALSKASWALIRDRRFEDAAQLISRASLLDPYHVQTRVHRALLSAAQGQDTQALTELEHLTQTYSDTGEAHLYAGTLSMGLNDPVRALAHFDRYLAEVPPSEQPPMLKSGVEKLRAQLANRR